MEIPPALLKFLQFIGISPTWLRWRLHEIERNRAEGKYKPRLPVWLQWLRYENKICPACGALVNASESRCGRCGAGVPSTGVYRLFRALGLFVPGEGGIITTGLFIAVILFVFTLSIVIGGPSAIMRPPTDLLIRFGLLWPDAYAVRWPELGEAERWRWLGFGLMHIGILHIIFNGMALMQAGPAIEAEIGPRRMLVLITFTQIAAAYAVMISGNAAAGASGWLFGLIGFGISHSHRHRRMDLRNHYFQWAVYGFIYGLALGAHNLAHAGGGIAGFLLGLTINLSPARKSLTGRIWDILFFPCLAAWIWAVYELGRSIAGG